MGKRKEVEVEKKKQEAKKAVRTTKHGRNSKHGRAKKSRSDLEMARALGRIGSKYLRNLSKAIARTKLAPKEKYSNTEGLMKEWR